MNSLWGFSEIYLSHLLLLNFLFQSLKLFLFLFCELGHWSVNLLDFIEFFILNSFLLLKFFKGFILFLNGKFHFIKFRIEFFKFKIEVFSEIFIVTLFSSGVIKLYFYNFKFILLEFLILLLWFDFKLLFRFFLKQFFILLFQR